MLREKERSRVMLAAPFRFALMLAFVVSLSSVASATSWQTTYSTDFSSDPLWNTDNSSRYYWNGASQDYTIKEIVLSTQGYSGVHDVGFNPGPFRFTYDISVASADWGGSVSFGMYGDYPHESVDHGSFVLVKFTHADEGYRIRMETSNSANVAQGITDSQAFSLDDWYHVEVEYDPLSHTLSADVQDKAAGQHLTSLNLSNVGPFSPDMRWIGSSDYRTGTNPPQYVGAQGIGTIDNVTFQTVPEPVSLASSAIGLACLGAYLRRRRMR